MKFYTEANYEHAVIQLNRIAIHQMQILENVHRHLLTESSTQGGEV